MASDFDYWKYMQSVSPGNRTFDEPISGDWQGNDYEYQGDSPEEFYDYLMTPRHHKRWSGSGAIKHFGPDRYASVRPEDAAMAQIVMKQMEDRDKLEFNRGVMESEEKRRGAIDEMLMPQGGGGGSISFTGTPSEEGGYVGPRGTRWGVEKPSLPVGGGPPAEGYEPGGPPDELTPGQVALLTGGESKVEAAARQGEAYGGGGGKKATNQQIAAAFRDLEMSAGPLKEQAMLEGGEWATMAPEAMYEIWVNTPDKIPQMMIEPMSKFAARYGYLQNLAGGSQERETWPPPGSPGG